MTSLLLALVLGLAPAIHAREVASVTIVVSDLDRALVFYTSVLPFEEEEEVRGDGTRTARLRLGRERVDLVDYTRTEGRAIPADSRSQDRWFQHVALVVSDMEAAYRLLNGKVAPVSPWPQRLPDWNPNAGGIEAFYFRDPDGHVLEAIAYPPGKGDPRWQEKGRVFLGIDHTAIVVDDTERSLAFWRDRLGFAVAGTSENHGPEQERLNAVRGARLRITGLKAPGGGPGVEFLEYLSPEDGRPYPADTRVEDLWSWTTRVRAAGSLQDSKSMRDPDGHAVLLEGEVGR